MKLAIISDVHANLQALETALTHIEACGVDEIYCLGDTVGYGGDPGPCIDLVRSNCTQVVAGNHDRAVAGLHDAKWLPPDGRLAAELHSKMISESQLQWLHDLPLRIDIHNLTLVHASPESPDLWLRINGLTSGQKQFEFFTNTVCFVGHTHVPAVMSDRIGVHRVRPGHRFLVNVGSVGQPRDRNPRLGFGLFDTDAVSFEQIRMPYNVEAAATRILELGLPRALGSRLRTGA